MIIPASQGEKSTGPSAKGCTSAVPLTCSLRLPRSSPGSPGLQGHQEEEDKEDAVGKGHRPLRSHHAAAASSAAAAVGAGG